MTYVSLRFSRNSKADALELVENLEEMFPWCYMDNDAVNRIKYSNTHW